MQKLINHWNKGLEGDIYGGVKGWNFGPWLSAGGGEADGREKTQRAQKTAGLLPVAWSAGHGGKRAEQCRGRPGSGLLPSPAASTVGA